MELLKRHKRLIWHWLLMSFVGVVLVCIYYPEWILQLGNAVLYDGTAESDGPLFVWNLWQFQHSLAEAINPYYTSQIAYPKGLSLVAHTYMPVVGLWSLFFSNKVLALNLFVVLNYAFGFSGVWLLARPYVHSHWLRLIPPVIFTFSAFRFFEMTEGHYNLICIGLVPYAMHLFLKSINLLNVRPLVQVKNWRSLWAFCFVFVCAVCTDYLVAYFIGYFMLVYVFAYYLWIVLRSFGRVQKVLILLAVFLSAHVCVKLLYSMGCSDGAALWFGASWQSFFMPFKSILYPDSWHSLYKTANPGGYNIVLFPGFFLILSLAVLAVAIAKRKIQDKIKPWIGVSLLLLMALMPALKLSFTTLYMPTAIQHFLPLLSGFRVSARYGELWVLCLSIPVVAVLDGYVLPMLKPRFRMLVSILLVLFAMAELYPSSFQTLDYQPVPAVYHQLKEKPGSVLMNVPFGLRDGMTQLGHVYVTDLMYQQVHQKKLLGGYISRMPEDVVQYYTSHTVCRSLLQIMETPDSQQINDMPEEDIKVFLKTFLPDYILIHPSYRGREAEGYLLRNFKPFITAQEEINGFLLISIKH